MRTKPYTETGLQRVNCVRCGAVASEQWSVKAGAMNGRRGWRALCTHCDVRLNELVLDFLAVPDFQEAVRAYRALKLEAA